MAQASKVILAQGYFEHWAKAGAKPVLVRDPGDLAASGRLHAERASTAST